MQSLRSLFFGPRPCFQRDLSGHTIVVTGATSGIGREVALDLAKSGELSCVVNGSTRMSNRK